MKPGTFHQSSWSWTTLAAALLVIGLTFPITTTASVLEPPTVPIGSPAWEGTAEIVGRGWLLAALPSSIALLVAWRLRRREDERDLEAAAALGLASVVVLAVGLVIGLLQVPRHPEPRLVVLTALFIVGVVLLGASLWLRHVPRP